MSAGGTVVVTSPAAIEAAFAEDEASAAPQRHMSAEVLIWLATADQMPDSDTTVLMWVQYADDSGYGADWSAGWHDGEHWRYCETGGQVMHTVTHWCQPVGPA